ncbi:MAG: hypothetical protein V4671_18990 [Armatimonadota bacterium]
MHKCSRSHCYAPETGCRSGEDDYRRCEYWQKGEQKNEDVSSEDSNNAAEDSEPVTLLPWSGNTMGIADVEFVASRRRPYVIGIIGPENAGKTTFLAMIYLLLRKGHFPDLGRFAGSYSLGGWEQLAGYFEWKSETGPEYPPHTSANEGRRPGLLHLAFRNGAEGKRDTLWTDAPGEWFRQWAITRENPGAAGARWTYEHSDALLLFADSAALAGDKRGPACANMEMLAERLGENLKDRKVALVWTKSDTEVAEPIRNRVETACTKNLPSLEIFRVNVPQKDLPLKPMITEFVRIMTWLLTPTQQKTTRIELPVSAPNDPLLAFRGEL